MQALSPIERDDAAPLGHKLVLFADSASKASCPENASSRSALGGQGIRFHRAGAMEEQEAKRVSPFVRESPKAAPEGACR